MHEASLIPEHKLRGYTARQEPGGGGLNVARATHKLGGTATALTLADSRARDWPLLEAVRYGVAASAACVMTEGTELCRLADTERLYGRIRDAVP